MPDPWYQEQVRRLGELLSDDETAPRDVVLEELATTLEELQATAEELQAQNEELGVAHQQIEVEHRRFRQLFDTSPDGYCRRRRAGGTHAGRPGRPSGPRRVPAPTRTGARAR
jgi:PAS domain-containing protein